MSLNFGAEQPFSGVSEGPRGVKYLSNCRALSVIIGSGMPSRGRSRNADQGPRISVVIPAYGRPEECSRAVRSALSQSLAPCEVLVVDDGSTPAVSLDLEDSRVRLIRLPVNSGASAARNRGVEAATGDWVAFLDSDDLWADTKLARQLADHRAEERVLLACNVTIKTETSERAYNSLIPKPPLDAWILIHDQGLQTSGLVAPRKLLLEFPFDERLRHFEDWDLVLRMARGGVVIDYIPDCLAIYHRYQGSTSARAVMADLLPWLESDDAPADRRTRYHYYLIRLFRDHARESPVQALKALRGLFNRTPNALTFSMRAIFFAGTRALLRRAGNRAVRR